MMVYVMAWSAHLVSAGFLLLAWWKLLGLYLPRFVRDIIWGCTAAVLLVPWYAGDSSEHFAPAFMVLTFEFLNETEYGEGSRFALLAACTLVLAFIILLAVYRWTRRTAR